MSLRLPEDEMQMLPHGNLGKGIVGAHAPEGCHVRSSGVGRMLLAFGIIIVLALLLDATTSRPVALSAPQVIGFPTLKGSVG